MITDDSRPGAWETQCARLTTRASTQKAFCESGGPGSQRVRAYLDRQTRHTLMAG